MNGGMPNGGTPVVRIEAEERIELSSVGVDIGSATTHMVFSTVTLEKVNARYETVERTVVYESPILLTPYDGPTAIDATALAEFVDGQYRAAGIARDAVETGALILTGVALLRRNSRRIAEVFAREAGKMVAVSAGDNMETVLAAHGSGAAERSAGMTGPLVHIDVGGGTTKIAVCRGGNVVETLAIDVGARLIVTDGSGVIVRLEEAGRRIGRTVGLDLAVGGRFGPDDRSKVVSYLAEGVLAGIGLGGRGQELFRGDPLSTDAAVAVSFSGGVAEYIHGRHDADYGDLGPALAGELKRRLAAAGMAILDTGNAGIRATAVGASQYTVQLSGSTIYISRPDAVPIRNVQVIAPPFDFDRLDQAEIADVLRKTLIRFDLTGQPGPIGVAFRWAGLATYARIDEFAKGLIAGVTARQDTGSALVLVSYEDVGRLIGSHISRDLAVARPVISVDCVEVGDFEFVDVGTPVPGTASVPVVIKSLVFPELS